MKFNFWKIFGSNDREINKIKKTVDQINVWEEKLEPKTIEALRTRILDLKQECQESPDKNIWLNNNLTEVFAIVRETAKRALGQRHYDVQLLGGIAIHQGRIAEMLTGEGKTLVASAPAVLNALTGEGVHIVSVNDYLVRRDAGWMGQIYHTLGLSTGAIIPFANFIYDPEFDNGEADFRLKHLRPVSREEAYSCDIVYAVNNELGFDYLRDNMISDISQKVQRKLYFAIVDEVDSILIDEARTPLIISKPDEDSGSKYQSMIGVARKLKLEEDFTLEEKSKTISILPSGINKLEQSLSIDNLYDPEHVEHAMIAEHCLKALHLFDRDKDYVVSQGEIVIVDEFTGRMLEGRRYNEGLHQAIEAKEGVVIQAESKTLATISFQNYFRLYQKLAGMTGTASTEAEEFHKIYYLDVLSIPTHRELIRIDYPDQIYKTREIKYQKVLEKVKEIHNSGQPILLGTSSIADNEFLSDILKSAGLEHEILNAKNNQAEAEIIAKAGQIGAITLATNIAGRGTDIVLSSESIALGGLFVLGTSRHESRRIDNQLRGRSGRQGDPGGSQFFISLEDDLMRIFGGDKIKSVMTSLGIAEDQLIVNPLISRSIESAQRKVEGYNFDIRKHLVDFDDVLNKHREIIYAKRNNFLTGENLALEIKQQIDQHLEQIFANEDLDLESTVSTLFSFFPVLDLEKSLQGFSDQSQRLVFAKDLNQHLFDLRINTLDDPKLLNTLAKFVSISAIDFLWVNHLTALEHLRTGIGLRGYGQQDPLVAYKTEAYKIFTELINNVNLRIMQTFYHAELTPAEAVGEIQTVLTKNSGKRISGSAGRGGDTRQMTRARKRAEAKQRK